MGKDERLSRGGVGLKRCCLIVVFMRFKISEALVTKVFWLLGLSLALQLAVPAHAHDGHDAESAKQHIVCSLCPFTDEPLKLAVAFGAGQIEIRVSGSVQHLQNHAAAPSGLHFALPPARAPPPKIS